MSRRNRDYKASQSIPSAQRQSLTGLRSQLASAASPDGITIELTQQVAENLMVSGERSVYVTAPGTFQSAMQSEANSMDSVQIPGIGEAEVKPKPKKTPGLKKAPSFGIQSTQCCGYHTVSGFQYTQDPDCEAFIVGIQQSYLLNAKNYALQRAENSKAEAAHYTNEATRTTRFTLPYPMVGYQPTKIAGMVVFTWNSTAYDPMAKKLAAFIKERSLGACSFSGKIVNPNSGHEIEAMTWLVNGPGYKKFVKERIGDYD